VFNEAASNEARLIEVVFDAQSHHAKSSNVQRVNEQYLAIKRNERLTNATHYYCFTLHYLCDTIGGVITTMPPSSSS